MKALLEASTQDYEKQLQSGTDLSVKAISYLKARGITKETAQFFRLGLVEESHVDSGHDFQVGRLAIPYVTPTGVVQIRFRALPYDGIPGNAEPSPKIKSEAGATTTIYNVRALTEGHETVAVCEGEFDTMSAVQAEIPAIGIPGANAWDKTFPLALKFRKVVILADNDDHGEGLKFAEQIVSSVRGARIVLMDKGHDVNSYLTEFGEEALKKKVWK